MGCNKRLKQANPSAKKAPEKIQNKEQEVAGEVKELNALQSDLHNYKDSSELTNISGWSVSEEWRFMRWLSKTFEITTRLKVLTSGPTATVNGRITNKHSTGLVVELKENLCMESMQV